MTSARRLRWGLVSVVPVLMGLLATQALAETRQASVGNYWFEDDARRDRTKIIVNQGDQITFTIREGIYPAHTVDVDELRIHSPDLLLGATFTTPQLNTAGTYKLYCRPHEQRGHVTTLFVRATATTTTRTTSASQPEAQPAREAQSPPEGQPPSQPQSPPPPATAGSGEQPVIRGPKPASPAPLPAPPAPSRASPVPLATPARQPGTPAPQPAPPAPVPSAPPSPPADDPPAPTLTPVGVGHAAPESLARAPEPQPGSLDDLIGRREARGAVPWTRAVRLLFMAAGPILGAAGYALGVSRSRAGPGLRRRASGHNRVR
jgi:plastocyanin